MIFARHIGNESSIEDASNEELKAWLKSIMPNDYLNQAFSSACAALNSAKKNPQNPGNLNEPLLTNKSIEVAVSLMKDTEMSMENECQVLVLGINQKNFDCPGMMNEDKVLKEYEFNSRSGHKASGVDGNNRDSQYRGNKHAVHKSRNQHTLKVSFR